MSDTVLTVYRVSKRFGRVQAVNDISFNVKSGEVVGIVGPNGAGKTTTLKMIVGLIKPDRGRILVYGYDVQRERVKALSLVGYVPENPVAPPTLRAIDLLYLIASFRRIPLEVVREDINYYLDVFNLSEAANKPIASLSRGTLQKLLIVSAFITRPKLLVMDEPLTGLDPLAQHVFKQEVRKLASKGCAVLISSHNLQLVEELCSRVILIRRGVKIFDGGIEELKNIVGSGKLEEAYLRLIGVKG